MTVQAPRPASASPVARFDPRSGSYPLLSALVVALLLVAVVGVVPISPDVGGTAVGEHDDRLPVGGKLRGELEQVGERHEVVRTPQPTMEQVDDRVAPR